MFLQLKLHLSKRASAITFRIISDFLFPYHHHHHHRFNVHFLPRLNIWYGRLLPNTWRLLTINAEGLSQPHAVEQHEVDFSKLVLIELVSMAQRLAHWDWRSGGPRFKSHPRLTSQSWSSYQLNQLGSKATSDSTLKQLTIAGIKYLYFTF